MHRKLEDEKILQSAGRKKSGQLIDSLSAGVFRKMEKTKRCCAAGLQKQSEKLSIRQKKIGLLLFCLVFGGICGWILVRAFRQSDHRMKQPVDITAPRHVTETGEPPRK